MKLTEDIRILLCRWDAFDVLQLKVKKNLKDFPRSFNVAIMFALAF